MNRLLYFVLGIGFSVPNEFSDYNANKFFLKSLNIVDAALGSLGTSDQNMVISVSPYGPMIALRDDNLQRVKKILYMVFILSNKQNLPLKAALGFGYLHIIRTVDQNATSMEGEVVIAVARVLARTDAGQLALLEDAAPYWSPSYLADNQPTVIRGKHESEQFRVFFIIYNQGNPLANQHRSQASLDQQGQDSDNKALIPRYMRRRCRLFPPHLPNLNQLYRQLVTNLQGHSGGDIPFHALRVSSTLEYIITRAIVCEIVGNVEQMLRVLQANRFDGEDDLYRILFHAIALEKSDLCENALKDLQLIISNTNGSSPLHLAAQFNMAVCYEKLGDFNKVQPDIFLDDCNIELIPGERLWHKAICLGLITAIRMCKPYAHEDLILKILNANWTDDPTGYAKLFVNWHLYRQAQPNLAEVDKMLQVLPRIRATTAQIGLLNFLRRTTPPGMHLEKILLHLDALADKTNFYATRKWLEDDINTQ